MLGPLLATLLATTPMSASPIRLEAEPFESGIRLRVVGHSEIECAAEYELEVSASAGGNRSVQRGSARLQPGREAVLATTTLGLSDGWSASLRVVSCDGKRYVQKEGGGT